MITESQAQICIDLLPPLTSSSARELFAALAIEASRSKPIDCARIAAKIQLSETATGQSIRKIRRIFDENNAPLELVSTKIGKRHFYHLATRKTEIQSPCAA